MTDRNMAHTTNGTAMQADGAFPRLPRPSYLDREWFDEELAWIFGRHWLYAGHVSELPEPGDFLVREVGAESIVVVRAEDGLHAFFNFCRHRGARICSEERGRVKRFICPYHRWSYGLDGALLGAPTMESVVDYDRHPLVSAIVEAWNGLIFISLAPEPPQPVATILAGASMGLRPLRLENAKVAHAAVYSVRANWKVVLENYFECYHCPGSHPEFCRVYDLSASPSAALDAAENPLAEHGSLPLKPGAASLTLDGRQASTRRFGGLSEDDLPVSEGFTLRPTTGGLFWGDYGIVFDFRPRSPGTTDMRCQWLVAGDAKEGLDYELDSLLALWDVTNRQDTHLCEIAQRGWHRAATSPGRTATRASPGSGRFAAVTCR